MARGGLLDCVVLVGLPVNQGRRVRETSQPALHQRRVDAARLDGPPAGIRDSGRGGDQHSAARGAEPRGPQNAPWLHPGVRRLGGNPRGALQQAHRGEARERGGPQHLHLLPVVGGGGLEAPVPKGGQQVVGVLRDGERAAQGGFVHLRGVHRDARGGREGVHRGAQLRPRGGAQEPRDRRTGEQERGRQRDALPGAAVSPREVVREQGVRGVQARRVRFRHFARAREVLRVRRQRLVVRQDEHQVL
mmetsp:Transcript_40935/g.80580  ORF Transcript_40935/g.80580 Transcript_40935/m.80580 type:complete len:247 (+) Transcript_40935:198-938(+)